MEEIEKDSGRDMTPRLIKDLGMRYPTEKSKHRRRYGLFECQYCKNEFECQIPNIESRHTRSCGCQSARYNNPHGLGAHRFYDTWRQMLQRCNNPKHKDYKDYGARGITVCEEWLDVANFVAWAESTHPNIEGMSLDRIDNDKGYSPENCRWTDALTQAHNKRMRSNNTSGFVGVYLGAVKNKWYAKVGSDNKLINIGSFHTKEEAVQARDKYIVEHNLPHKLSVDYKKES